MTQVKTPRTVFVALLAGGQAARMGDLFQHWADGLYTLPPQLERALDRLGEVQDMFTAAAPVPVGQATSDWAHRLVEAAWADTPAPTLDDLAQASAKAMQGEPIIEGLRQAQSLLVMQIAEQARVHHDVIFDHHVRPPLVELYDHVMQVSAVLGPMRSAEDLLVGTDAQRAAWLQLPPLANKYRRLRSAVIALDGAGWQQSGYLHTGMPDMKNDVDVLSMVVPSPIDDDADAGTTPTTPTTEVVVPSTPDKPVDKAAAARGAAATAAYIDRVRGTSLVDDPILAGF